MKGLIDSTLREGSQMVGVSFSLAEKKQIIANLVDLGIEEIELGIATPYDRDLPALVRYCRKLTADIRVALWCPCKTENIDYAIRLQPDVLSLSIPGSDILIQKKLERDSDWVLDTVLCSVQYARKGGIGYVSLGIEDATRADESFLHQLVSVAEASGAARIRLADTVGIATPHDIASLVRTVQSYFQGDIGVHMHNDFGMASGNSLAALDAGSDYADVTVLGIGERSGNARLEEIAGFLALRQGRHYESIFFKPLAQLVADISGRRIDPHQPVIGERIFHCETGLHLQGLKNDTTTYEPFDPEKVGGERKWLYGEKIGRREIKDCLERFGTRVQLNQIEPLVSEVRKVAGQLNQPLPQKEFCSLLSSLHSHL
jgi:homocitrate synthase NifV